MLVKELRELCDEYTSVTVHDVETRNEIEVDDIDDLDDLEILRISADGKFIRTYVECPTQTVSVDIVATYRTGIEIEVPMSADTYDYVREYVRELMNEAPSYISVQHDDCYAEFELSDYDHDIW